MTGIDETCQATNIEIHKVVGLGKTGLLVFQQKFCQLRNGLHK